MKSAINKVSLLEEDANSNLSKFRRRNKILILVFAAFFISLTLIIAALMILNVVRHADSKSGRLRLNPAVQAFYDAVMICDTASCREAFNPIIDKTTAARFHITDPNQIFILSLQTAADQLQNITTSHKNCSVSLRFGSGQIRGVLATVRGNPFVEKMSEEPRVAIMNRIGLARDDVQSCVDDLEKVVESTAEIEEVRAKVLRVMVHLRCSVNFVLRYDEAILRFYTDMDAVDWRKYRNMISDNIFIIYMCGLQLLFIFFLYWSLFRFG